MSEAKVCCGSCLQARLRWEKRNEKIFEKKFADIKKIYTFAV